MEELLNKLKEINAIRAIGDYADYEPNGKHKDTIYFAEDEEKVYLNGKSYGGPNDEDLANILEDYAKISDLEIVELPSSVVNINRLFDDASGMGFSSDIVDELFSILNKAYNRNGLLKYVIKRQPQNGRNETIIFVITQSSWTIENGIEPKVNLFTVYNNVIYNFTVNPLNASFTRTKIEKVNISDETGNSTTSVMSQKACTDSFVQKEKGKQLSSNDFNNDYKEKLINTYTNEQVDNHLIQLGNNLRDYSESLAMGVYNDLNNSKVNKVAGKQLSTEDFTTLLKEKLEGLENYDDTEIQTKLTQLKNNLDTILDAENSTAVIDTFQEIENFLSGITNQETLTGLLQDLKSDILALCANTYVTKSTDEEISGNKTFTNSEGIVIKRNNGVAKIKFNSNNNNVGAIGSDGDLKYWKESTNKWETVYHSGNDGSGSGLDADLLDGKHSSEFLQKGTLAANADLNDISISGSYISNNTLLNTPIAPTYGNTVIHYNIDVNSAEQFYITNGSNRSIYYRTKQSGTWNDWKQIAFTDSNVASANKLNLNILGTNKDLNEIKESGIYSSIITNIVRSLINAPDWVSSNAGECWLHVVNNDTNGFQILFAKKNTVENHTYYRVFDSSDNFSPWKELAFTNSNVASADKVTIKQLTNEDLNDIKDENFNSYYAKNNDCINVPDIDSYTGFGLQVFKTGNVFIVQILITFNGSIYKRAFNGTSETWSTWQQILSNDGVTGTANKLNVNYLALTDLNNVKTNYYEIYCCDANSPYTNAPDNLKNFILHVIKGYNEVIQIITNYKKSYIRRYNGVGWTDWKKILDESDIQKTWVGTEAEYNAIETKDSNTIYYIKE